MNSSRFDKRSRTIFWHVHWQFPAADESVHNQKVSEQTPLIQVLQQHISLTPGNSMRRHALRAYVEAGIQDLQIVMRKEHCPVGFHALHAVHALLPPTCRFTSMGVIVSGVKHLSCSSEAPADTVFLQLWSAGLCCFHTLLVNKLARFALLAVKPACGPVLSQLQILEEPFAHCGIGSTKL